MKTKEQIEDELYFGSPERRIDTLKWFTLSAFVNLGVLVIIGSILYVACKAFKVIF